MDFDEKGLKYAILLTVRSKILIGEFNLINFNI